MRRKDREITDIIEIEEILKAGKVCHLALVDEGLPYIVPLNYGYKDQCLYFHSAKVGKKVEILMKSPQVCFEVDVDMTIVGGDRACDYTAKYKSVIGMGKAVFVEDDAEKKKGLDVLMSQYVENGPSSFEYSAKELERIAVIKVEIDQMTGKKSGY